MDGDASPHSVDSCVEWWEDMDASGALDACLAAAQELTTASCCRRRPDVRDVFVEWARYVGRRKRESLERALVLARVQLAEMAFVNHTLRNCRT